ncbi:ATP-binding cassette domain-containing protein [Micromonospora echinofusca]|uniref:ATP-binding cassette domain-containing protein n=1 Tax=Micromonospora echinofusca TaxID=47858 RepID=A0ABS3VPF5_MICEH|nr:ATP-binding cassette domain-containing protein [Micromonospora echinofusca]
MLRVTGLTAHTGSGKPLVDGVSFTLAAGQVLAVIGASGSGKTTTGRALLGETGPGVRLTGRIEFAGRPVTPDSPPPPGTVGYVPQQPAAVLNPVRRVGSVLREIAHRHAAPGGTGRTPLRQAVAGALARVGLPDSRDLLRRFPHQLSGGQQQRLVLAHALLSRARLLIADEPTTGQDRINRADIAAELRGLATADLAVVLLSHDLDLVRAVADHTLVLAHGTVRASGPTAEVLALHQPPRTVGGGRSTDGDRPDRDRPPVLRVTGLVARHRDGARRPTVLHGVDASVTAGQCLAVVGRSGSGKTTLARCVAGLHRPAAGTVELDGRRLAAGLDRRSRTDLAAVQYVFQDPRASFHPHRPLLDQVARVAVRLRDLQPAAARQAAQTVLTRVGLTEEFTGRHPDRLSGGELQRAALARALLARPRLLICDEITSGLDAGTQERILDLVEQLRRTDQVTLVVISHDREVVARLADHVVVLDRGRVVEHGPAADLLTAGRHPLTRALLRPTDQLTTKASEPR